MTTETRPPELDHERVGAFAQHVAETLVGGATTAMMVLGDRLGLYAALSEIGPTTPGGLADTTGTTERYVREWLAQQTAVGFVQYDTAGDSYTLPPEHAAVLATDDSPATLISCAPLITGFHRGVERMSAAFRTGEGVAWAAQDPTVFESTDRFWGAQYRTHLVADWVPALDGMQARLEAGASVADIGCGRGTALTLLARAFPRSRFVGYDVHEPSLAVARERAAEAGISDRVRYELAHCHGYPLGDYDMVTFFDTLHDLGDPAGAVAHARSALAEGGSLLVVEPAAADSFVENVVLPGAGLNYAASTFLCTANSLSQPVGVALGAQIGATRVTALLADAGFGAVRRVADTPFNMVFQARIEGGRP